MPLAQNYLDDISPVESKAPVKKSSMNYPPHSTVNLRGRFPLNIHVSLPEMSH